LFKAEEAIWGSDKKYGKVALEVISRSVGSSIRPSEIVPDRGTAQTGPMERFFLHPFNENRGENLPEASGYSEVAFVLRVTVAELEPNRIEEVRTAIRAWLTFGGIGARTRRGLGALVVDGADRTVWHPSNPGQLGQWLAPEAARDVTHTTLAGARAFFGPSQNATRDRSKAEVAWRELGKFWTRFRKGHFTDANPSYNPMKGGSWEDHRKLQNLEGRASEIELVKPFLGLPIVYQRFRNSDAFAGTLEAAAKPGSRMASPVILKPVAFADNTVRPMVLLLKAPEPEAIKIGGQQVELRPVRRDRVLLALNAEDVMDAVGKAAAKCGFTEEVRL
jgi:CRISPR-associated protein Cmr1